MEPGRTREFRRKARPCVERMMSATRVVRSIPRADDCGELEARVSFVDEVYRMAEDPRRVSTMECAAMYFSYFYDIAEFDLIPTTEPVFGVALLVPERRMIVHCNERLVDRSMSLSEAIRMERIVVNDTVSTPLSIIGTADLDDRVFSVLALFVAMESMIWTELYAVSDERTTCELLQHSAARETGGDDETSTISSAAATAEIDCGSKAATAELFYRRRRRSRYDFTDEYFGMNAASEVERRRWQRRR